MILDAGNSLIGDRGTAVSTQGKSSVAAMNMLGYDALALGEGDLSKLGLELLLQRAQEAKFAILSANAILSETGELLFPPYIIKEIQGYRIAVIGLTGPITTPQVIVRDPLESVRKIVAELQDRVEIIILLSHAGLNVNHKIAVELPQIDLVISGGGQGTTPAPLLTADGRMTLHADSPSPGHAGRRIGVGNWTFDPQGRALEHTWRQVALGPEIANDPQLLAWAKNKSP